MKKCKFLLAVPIFMSLIGCGKTLEKTTHNEKTTANNTTTDRLTRKKTTRATKTENTTTDITTTKHPTTRKRSGKANIINIYSWNDVFQSRLNSVYGGKEEYTIYINGEEKKIWQGRNVSTTNGSVTILRNGISIQWTMATNQGNVYQDILDTALDNNMVDMYFFEADYAKKYVNSDYAMDMAELGVDQSDQFWYTKDVVTNEDGKLVGSTWYAEPGVIVYNNEIAKAVWGDDITTAQVEEKIGSNYESFKQAASQVNSMGYNIAVGPYSIYKLYTQNLSARMYNSANNTITVDRAYFEYAIQAKELSEYMAGTDDTYGQWTSNWQKEMGKDSNTLCMFGCPWFVDSIFKGYRGEITDPSGDSGWRVCEPFRSYFWGGTWITATPVSQQEETIRGEISNIIKKMTTDTSTLMEINSIDFEGLGAIDFVNTKSGMETLRDTTYEYYGNSKVIDTYLDSVKRIDVSKMTYYDRYVDERFYASFISYIRGNRTATVCWDEFVRDLENRPEINVVNKSYGIIIGDNITIS